MSASIRRQPPKELPALWTESDIDDLVGRWRQRCFTWFCIGTLFGAWLAVITILAVKSYG